MLSSYGTIKKLPQISKSPLTIISILFLQQTHDDPLEREREENGF
jgi:hypothetical protein